MDELLNFAVSLMNSAAILVIISLGLAVTFGMMGIINFAHGEFLMLGAFVTLSSHRAGIPFGVAIFVAALAVGCVGLVVERLLIQRLYGRLAATMLATFGLSLILAKVAELIWGTSTQGLPTPLGSVRVGAYSYSGYTFLLIGAAVTMLVLVYVIFTRTRFGVMARAAMQRPEMAMAVGVNTRRIHMLTFSIGAALAGAGGALLAPIVAVTPNMGQAYVARSFMTVVVGGPSPLSGTAASAGLLGSVQHVVSDLTTAFLGVGALLVVAIVILRFLPTGLSARWRTQL